MLLIQEASKVKGAPGTTGSAVVAPPFVTTIHGDAVRSQDRGQQLCVGGEIDFDDCIDSAPVRQVPDPQIVAYFHERYDHAPKGSSESTLRRLHLLTFDPILRAALSQAENRLDPRPVMDAGVTVFDTEDDAIRMANDTIYGLAAYFHTKDYARMLRVAERLEYGIVGANDGIISSAAAPFGGIKESGYGREGGPQGIDEYLDVKYVSIGHVG